MKTAAALLLAALAAQGQPRGLVEGQRDSAVQVVIYEDLQCSDCANFRRMLDTQLLPRYGARVAFIHRDFPLAKHAWVRQAAVAARLFEEINPETAVAWRRHIMTVQKQTSEANFAEGLAAFARTRGVDAARAASALQDPRLAALVEKDYQEGVARGVVKTPTVFVNGQPFIERFTFEEISKAIDEALR